MSTHFQLKLTNDAVSYIKS